MHSITFLQDLAVVVIVAGGVTVIFRMIRQPVVLGYILAGLIIGPYTLPFPLVRDQGTIRTMAELGIVFLMFSLGLEFSLRKLKQIGTTALAAGLFETLLMFLTGYGLGQFFEWGPMNSVFLGAMLSISSTTIIVKVLGDLGLRKEKFASIIFGILIVEDVIAIIMIALLSGVAVTGSLQLGQIFSIVGHLAIFLTATLVVGLIAVPRLLRLVAKFESNEMLLVTVLGLCFGVSLLAVKLQYSVALGAFVIGAVVAESREIGRIEKMVEPIRDLFCAIYFVAVGMLIEPRLLLEYALPITLISGVFVVGKMVGCALGAFLSGQDDQTSMKVGTGMAQLGEFSFVIASLGLTLDASRHFLYPIAVSVSAVTTLISPHLIRKSGVMVDWFNRSAPGPVIHYFEFYTRWVSQMGSTRKNDMARQLLQKWFWQMVLNTFLMAGMFAAAAYFVRRAPFWFPQWNWDEVMWRTIGWLGATLLSLPFFVATYRKLQAFGLLVGELSVEVSSAGEGTQITRKLLSQSIPLAGIAVLGILTLALSSALLPPFRVLWVLACIVGLVLVLFWRSFVKFYSQAQFALIETFEHKTHSLASSETPEAHPMLREAELAHVPISPKCPAANKLIRELQLRTGTGASIVGIERFGKSIINPGPDEEIKPGDQVFLIGTHAQLELGRKALKGK